MKKYFTLQVVKNPVVIFLKLLQFRFCQATLLELGVIFLLKNRQSLARHILSTVRRKPIFPVLHSKGHITTIYPYI